MQLEFLEKRILQNKTVKQKINIKEWLIKHEGLKVRPYYDTLGNLTIGVGRNLSGSDLESEIIFQMLDNDIARCKYELSKFDWYKNSSDNIQACLENMCFNMGINKLLQFKNMIKALSDKNYELAAKEAIDSKWTEQVKGRATEIAEVISKG